MQAKKRIVILTGANRGLGRRTAEILLERYAQGFMYIFTERSKDHTELQTHLTKVNKYADFEIRDLDVTDKLSRDVFLRWFSDNYNTVDVIFNNAGVYDKNLDAGSRPTRGVSEFTLGVNFISTVEFTEELYPYLSEDGRILEMSSMLGKLEHQPQKAREILSDPTLTKDKLLKLTQDYINNSDYTSKDLVFSPYVYFTSKALLTTYVRFVASKYIKSNQSVFAIHPGWVQTDMGGEKAPMTTDEAAPYLAIAIAAFPFGRHPLSGKLLFKNEDFGY